MCAISDQIEYSEPSILSGSKKKGSAKRQQKRVRLSSNDLPALQQARALWISKRFRQSLDLFDRAVKQNPGNTLALTDAARAFGARFEFERAERLVERLIELGGHRADILQMAGQSFRMIQRPERAIECLEMSLAQSPELFEPRLELALLYERRSQLEHAQLHVAECLERNPKSPEGNFLHGRVLRRMGQPEQAESILRKVATTERHHPIVRAQAWHELGQLLDAAGQYDEAFEAVTRGKEVQRADAKAMLRQSELESNRLEHLHDGLTAKHFRRWRDEAADDRSELPTDKTALLTGPPRSGTTLLERILDAHTSVVSSDEQIAFASYILPSLFLNKGPDELLSVDDLDAVDETRLHDERLRYFRYLSGALRQPIEGRTHIDKNPSMVMLIPGMLRLFPQCKLLIAIRDPRDVAVSCFMRYLPLNSVSVQFLTIDGAARRNLRDMRAWLRLRDLIGSPWLETRYEDVVDDLEREARRVVNFLELPWEESVLDYRDNLQQRQVNSPTYEDVEKPVYRSAMGRWRNYEKHLGKTLELVDSSVKELRYD